MKIPIGIVARDEAGSVLALLASLRVSAGRATLNGPGPVRRGMAAELIEGLR